MSKFVGVMLGCMLAVTACSSTEEKSTSTQATGSSTDATAVLPSAAPPAPVRGVEGDTIKIGFLTAKNQDAAQAKLGTTGITFVPHDEIVTKLVDDLNANGGLAGKKLVPVLHVTDVTGGADPQTISNEICATFTEDNQVYAVLSNSTPSDQLLACLNKAQIPLIVSSGGTFSFADKTAYDANPLFFNGSGINLDSAAKALVQGLNTAGWFTTDAVLGVIRLTSPAFDAAAKNSLDPALAAIGVKPAVYTTIAEIATNDDIARFSTEAQAAVLKMKEAGVTHLMFFESGGGAPFFFLAAAKGQGFAPTLGFSTLSGGESLVQNIKGGGTSVSWSPVGDVPTASELPESPEAKKCLDLIDSTRAAFTSPNATSETLRFCDATWLLQAGVKAAGGPVAPTDLQKAIEGLGSSYQSPAALSTTFGPSKHDGVSEYYITDYDPACSCNVYRKNGPTPIG